MLHAIRPRFAVDVDGFALSLGIDDVVQMTARFGRIPVYPRCDRKERNPRPPPQSLHVIADLVSIPPHSAVATNHHGFLTSACVWRSALQSTLGILSMLATTRTDIARPCRARGMARPGSDRCRHAVRNRMSGPYLVLNGISRRETTLRQCIGRTHQTLDCFQTDRTSVISLR